MTVVVRARNGSFSFDSPAGQRILYSALSNGVQLPHECVTGTCGTCKARLRSGTLDVLWRDAPGWSLIKPGEYLLCQCAATVDCEVEIRGTVGQEDVRFAPRHRRGIIRDWRLLCADVGVFSVELECELTFEAGQFAALGFRGLEGARCYSMVNSDSPTTSLDFVIKRKSGGAVSEWLFAQDRSSEAVDCFGPVGKATYDPDAQRDLLCIAGGTGIAGMMSILRRAARQGHFNARRADVFFGLRSARDAFFLSDLSSLVHAYPAALRVTVALSDETPAAELTGGYPALAFDTGKVHEVVARESSAIPAPHVSAYVAGPPAAVIAALRVLLVQLKVSPAAIRYDKFG
jgi:toluene monooxygenase electron transfer component